MVLDLFAATSRFNLSLGGSTAVKIITARSLGFFCAENSTKTHSPTDLPTDHQLKPTILHIVSVRRKLVTMSFRARYILSSCLLSTHVFDVQNLTSTVRLSPHVEDASVVLSFNGPYAFCLRPSVDTLILQLAL